MDTESSSSVDAASLLSLPAESQGQEPVAPNGSATFRHLLKHFRALAGLSQSELAERAGLSARGLSDLERGVRLTPRPATARLLADVLGLTEANRVAFLSAAQNIAHPVTPSASKSKDTALPAAPALRISLPTGIVTFLFTDIEGSTTLLQRLGDRYADLLARHQRLLRATFAAQGGYEINTQSDSVFVAFPTAPQALAAALAATQALAAADWPKDMALRVRMGLHSGAPQVVGDNYIGLDIDRAARIAAAGHGGQLLLSADSAELACHELPTGVHLRDLGEHRLKDLSQPGRVYQVLGPDLVSDFPPLHALDARPHNLPVQPSALLGREREVAAVCHLLRRDDMRLVTLTGPGGIGKTRLSLQVAAEALNTFPDGVWVVRLSRLTDPALVLSAVARVFDLKTMGTVPLREALQSNLRAKRLLLVLDNFEQVVEAASDVAELLATCPGVRALVTSRVPLRLRGEHEYALRPLALPDLEHLPSLQHLTQYAAVMLFIERAQAVQADFQATHATVSTVAEICTRLDGVPLAIELAAARVKSLPPTALLKRLERALPLLTGGPRDADERQQTMRATLDWSYHLLSPQEQRLFRRLAVFVGGCTLESAEAVCAAPAGAEPLEIDVFEGLSQLVDKSLMWQRERDGESRFGMLHVIREYALDQLDASEETVALRRNHAAYYLAQWQALNQEKFSGAKMSSDVPPFVFREHDDTVTALTWATNKGDLDMGLQFVLALRGTWIPAGHSLELRPRVEQMLERALTQAGVTVDQAARMHLTYHATPEDASTYSNSILHVILNAAELEDDPERATTLFTLGLEWARAVNDYWGQYFATNGLSFLAFSRGDIAQGIALGEESIALINKTNMKALTGIPVAHLGYALLIYARNDQRAEARLLEAQEIGSQTNNQYVVVFSASFRAMIEARRHERAQAEATAREALITAYTKRLPYTIPMSLQALAMASEDTLRAVHLWGAASALRERMGAALDSCEREFVELSMAQARAALGKESWAAAFAAGRELNLEEAIAEALGETVPHMNTTTTY